jgi:hypothetical protein
LLASSSLSWFQRATASSRDTLEALFTTHLRNDQIVLSLLLSRLTKLAAILLAGIPILSFLQFLGGIDPGLVFADFAATGMLVLSVASLGLLLSIYAGKARRAIVQTECIVVGYLLATIFVEAALKSPLIVRPGSFWLKPLLADYTPAEILAWPGIGNPVVASYRIHDNLLPSMPFASLLRSRMTEYVLFHLAVAVFCVAWSILRFRAVALRDQESALEQEVRKRRLSALGRWWRRVQLELPLLWKGLVVDARSPRRLSDWIFRGCGVRRRFWLRWDKGQTACWTFETPAQRYPAPASQSGRTASRVAFGETRR